jgi:hypothetical protein
MQAVRVVMPAASTAMAGSQGDIAANTVTFTNSTISGNMADFGSGFWSESQTVINSANSDNSGGGVSNVGGTLTISGSTVSGNTGGGISKGGFEGSAAITNCTINGKTDIGILGGAGYCPTRQTSVSISRHASRNVRHAGNPPFDRAGGRSSTIPRGVPKLVDAPISDIYILSRTRPFSRAET